MSILSFLEKFIKPEVPNILPQELEINPSAASQLQETRRTTKISKEASNLMEDMQYCTDIFKNLPDSEKFFVVELYIFFNCKSFSKADISNFCKVKNINFSDKVFKELIEKKVLIPFRPSDRIQQTKFFVVKSQYTNIIFNLCIHNSLNPKKV